MRRYSLIIWCILVAFFAFSQDELMPVYKSGKWAAVDTNLKLVTSYEYDELNILKGKLICAKKVNHYGLITKAQKLILPFEYEQISDTKGEYLIIKKNGLWGVRNADGSLILDCIFKSITIFKPEIAILEIENGWHFYDFTKKIKSEVYDVISEYGNKLLLLEKNGEKRLYNYQNRERSKKFVKIVEKKPYLFFCTTRNDEKFVLNAHTDFKHYKTYRFAHFLIGLDNYAYAVNNSLRIINSNGEQLKVIKAESISRLSSPYTQRALGSYFSEDYYVFEVSGKLGLLNSSFETLTDPEYDRIHLSDSLFYVYKNRNVGLIAKNGSIVLPAKYERFKVAGDFWLVGDNFNWGVALHGGKELIKLQYSKISLAFGNKFIVEKNGETGILNSQGNTIYPFAKQKISIAKKCFIVERDSLYGLVGINGNVIFSPKYKEIRGLNPDYFAYTENKKAGIISRTGNKIIKAQFRNISPTENDKIFLTESFKYNYRSLEEIKKTYGLKLYIPKNDIRKRRYKVGVINIYGQILLEPNYFNEQINADFQGNTIIVKRDSSVLVVSFEEDGKLIDKTSYKNYVFVQPANFRIKRNYWKKASRNRNYYYGLFSPRGRTILDYRFKTILSRFLNHPDLVRTTSPGGRYGIVNERTGKTVLEDVYKVIYTSDLQKANVIRCVKNSGRASLIDSVANVLIKGIGYIDDFKQEYARVNKGGKLTYKDDHTQKLYINRENNVVPKRKEGQEGRDIICQKGKWGVIDKNGNWMIKPKYQFLQSYANGVFIAKKEIKWGIISPSDELLIDFIYDEIRHFTNSKEGEWAAIPYFKIRVKDKWGVIDNQGNIVVPIQYSGVEHLVSKGKIYFKTINDNKKVLYGLVDKKGRLVLEPKYEFIDQFKDGFARLQIARKEWKFVNKQMLVFPEKSYIKVKGFNEGLAAVKRRKGWGFINEKGQEIIPCQYLDVGNFNEGLAKAKIYIPSKMMGLIRSKRVYALIDKKGSVVHNTNSRFCSDVSNGNIIVKKGRKYQLLTTKGKKVLPGAYDRITENPKYGLYAVKIRGKGAALYNNKAQLIVPFGIYNDFSTFSEGLCYVSGKQNGFIDITGALKIRIECKDAKNFNDGRAAVRLDKGLGYTDSKGIIVIKGQYSFAWNFQNGVAKVKDKDHRIYYIDKFGSKTSDISFTTDKNYKVITVGGFKGIMNKVGQWKVYPAASQISLFRDGLAPVGIRKQYGLYSSQGNLLTEPNYMILETTENDHIKMINLEELKYLDPVTY